MEKESLIFLHIIKTGGSAISHYLEQTLSKNEIYRCYEKEDYHSWISSSKSDFNISQKTNEVRVVYGHAVKYRQNQFTGAHFSTLVREPFERLVSQYFYERRNAQLLNIPSEERPLPHETTASDFYDAFLRMVGGQSDHRNPGGHLQTNNVLQARTMADFFDINLSEFLEDGLDELVNKYQLILIHKHFPLSIFLLHHLYEIPLRPVPMANSYSRLIKTYFPQRVRDECRSMCEVDYNLYDYCLLHFDSNVKNLLDGSLEMNKNIEQYYYQTNDLLIQQIVDFYKE